MSLGRNLKQIRRRWGMSQEEFGALLNLSRVNISSYEQGLTDPKIPVLLQLEEKTGIPVYTLYSEELDLEQIPPQPLEGPVAAHQREGDNRSVKDRVEDLEQALARIKRELEEGRGK